MLLGSGVGGWWVRWGRHPAYLNNVNNLNNFK